MVDAQGMEGFVILDDYRIMSPKLTLLAIAIIPIVTIATVGRSLKKRQEVQKNWVKIPLR